MKKGETSQEEANNLLFEYTVQMEFQVEHSNLDSLDNQISSEIDKEGVLVHDEVMREVVDDDSLGKDDNNDEGWANNNKILEILLSMKQELGENHKNYLLGSQKKKQIKLK